MVPSGMLRVERKLYAQANAGEGCLNCCLVNGKAVVATSPTPTSNKKKGGFLKALARLVW